MTQNSVLLTYREQTNLCYLQSLGSGGACDWERLPGVLKAGLVEMRCSMAGGPAGAIGAERLSSAM